MEYKSYWKRNGRLEKLKKIMQYATSFKHAVQELKQYGINSNIQCLYTLCRIYKIPRPNIKRGGGRKRT